MTTVRERRRRARRREGAWAGFDWSTLTGLSQRDQVLRLLALGGHRHDIARVLGVPVILIRHWAGGGVMRRGQFFRALRSQPRPGGPA
jgi:hypothetical protein